MSQATSKKPRAECTEKCAVLPTLKTKPGLPISQIESSTKKPCQEVNRVRSKPKRPDMQLYVPRARRTQFSSDTTYSTTEVCSSDQTLNSGRAKKSLESSVDKMQANSSKKKHEMFLQQNCDKDKHSSTQINPSDNQSEIINLDKDESTVSNKTCDNENVVEITSTDDAKNFLSIEKLIRDTSTKDENILNDNYVENIIHNNAALSYNCNQIEDILDISNELDKVECSLENKMEQSSVKVCTSVDEIVLDEILTSQNILETIPFESRTENLEEEENFKIINQSAESTNVLEQSLLDNPIDSVAIKDVLIEEDKILQENDVNNEESEVSQIKRDDEDKHKEHDSSTEIKEIKSAQTNQNNKVDCTEISKLENVEESWDAMFDDSGECLNPDILKELTSAVGDVKINKSKYNYYEFQPHEPDVSGEEFGHIVEFYDFPVDFKNQDLITIFCNFKNDEFNIKWVDDTHALGVFANPLAARNALNLKHPLLKVRPLSQGIRESKFKAKRCAEFLQPYRPRPETSATIARRLVSGALGVRVQIPKEQRELERQKLKEARDRRRQAAKQKQDIWDGVVS